MEKMVLRSAEALRDSCEVTAAGIEDPAADVNHWAHYLDLWQRRETCVSGESKTSFWVTHVDDPYKLRIVRDLCASGKAAICLSSDMAAALDAMKFETAF